MKSYYRYFLLLILPGLPVYTFSQPFGDAASGYRVKYLDYQNSSGEQGRTYFNYDSKNSLYRSFWTLVDGSRNSVNFYDYDSYGNLVSAFRDFSDGLKSTEVFIYDSFGNKVEEYFHRSDSLRGKAFYEYSGNKITEAHFENYKGWLNGDLKISYNDYNQRSGAAILKGNDTICDINYEYDVNGNLFKETWRFKSGWQQIFTYSYEKKDSSRVYYSSPFLRLTENYRIKNEDYSFNGEAGGPSLYEYDSNGLLIKKEFIRSDSLSTFTKYKYDDKGKLISSYRNYSDGRKAEFTYSYDEGNHLILRNFYLDDHISGFEVYHYNQNGALIMAFLEKFDSWLTGTLCFPADKNYRIPDPTKPVYAKFLGENGFDAELFFQYDSNELLREIRWEFSFGKYQLYKFEYMEWN